MLPNLSKTKLSYAKLFEQLKQVDGQKAIAYVSNRRAHKMRNRLRIDNIDIRYTPVKIWSTVDQGFSL